MFNRRGFVSGAIGSVLGWFGFQQAKASVRVPAPSNTITISWTGAKAEIVGGVRRGRETQILNIAEVRRLLGVQYPANEPFDKDISEKCAKRIVGMLPARG
jgi:hypothetical protein